MKYMAFDYGTKFVGIALSDGLRCMAFPKEVVPYTSDAFLAEKIAFYTQTEHIYAFVVGVPLYQDGTYSVMTQRVIQFIRDFLQQYELPIYLVNEYLSSDTAKAITRKNKTKRVDAYAATLILEMFLSFSEVEKNTSLWNT